MPDEACWSAPDVRRRFRESGAAREAAAAQARVRHERPRAVHLAQGKFVHAEVARDIARQAFGAATVGPLRLPRGGRLRVRLHYDAARCSAKRAERRVRWAAALALFVLAESAKERVTVTLVDWRGRKRFPADARAALTPWHVNSGVTAVDAADTRADVLVYCPLQTAWDTPGQPKPGSVSGE